MFLSFNIHGHGNWPYIDYDTVYLSVTYSILVIKKLCLSRILVYTTELKFFFIKPSFENCK